MKVLRSARDAVATLIARRLERLITANIKQFMEDCEVMITVLIKTKKGDKT